MSAHHVGFIICVGLILYTAGTILFLLARSASFGIGPWTAVKATAAVFVVTAIVTGLQLIFPSVLETLRRDPEALRAGEWWRVVTPLFVQSDGWPQIITNGLGLLLVGPFVERALGSRVWLLLYFGAGLVGEVAGYAWEPHGAGNSIAICGLLGALYLLPFWWDKSLPAPARVLGIVGLAGAVGLSVLENHHGPPILVGACIAAVILWRGMSAFQRVPQQSA